MRSGEHPAKALDRLGSPRSHRVILPVFIPTLSGYYEHALEVLRLCVESLHHSAGSKAAVTAVSNGSAAAVVEALEKWQALGWIDQVVINRDNRGKVDAALGVARGAFEELITISDCDVLFRTGWVEAVEEIFRAFPECGLASPVPNPGSHCHWYHTSATMVGALARNELRFARVVPEPDLDRFAHSIGNPGFYGPEARSSQLIVRRNGVTACVGCGHFVVTLRRHVVRGLPDRPSLQAVSGTSEELWIDQPPDQMGYWRLAPTRAYAYHMGNVPEPWMNDELQITAQAGADADAAGPVVPIGPGRPSQLPPRLRHALVRILRRTGFIRPTNWVLNAVRTGAENTTPERAGAARVPASAKAPAERR